MNGRLKVTASSVKAGFSPAAITAFLRQRHRVQPVRKQANTRRCLEWRRDLWRELNRPFDATGADRLSNRIPRLRARV